MLNNVHLIIPMSGIGKRFIDAGYIEPKPLINVDGKPMIEHVVNLFPNVNKITFICNSNHLRNTNMLNILKNISPNSKILEVEDGLKKGPVYAIYKSLEHIDNNEEIIFSYCDYGTVWDFNKFLSLKSKYDGLIPCYRGFHPHMLGSDNYAFCKMNGEYVCEIKEKQPFTNNKMSEFASNGTYYFKSGNLVKKYFQELIDLNMNVNGEYYISLVYNLLIRDGFKIGVFEIEKMLQWGTPYDLEVYNGWSKYFKNVKKNTDKSYCPPETTLILPMAGKGSRFSLDGYELPKPLINVNNNIMVVEAVKCLPETNKKVFICLNEHCSNYKLDTILLNNFGECDIIKLSGVTDGQAVTCEIGLEKSKINLENPILISACDNGIVYDNEKLQSIINDENNDIIVWTFRNNQSSKLNPNAYAWLDVDTNNNVKHVSCKNFIYDDPLKTHAIVGTIFFRRAKYFLDGLLENKNKNITTNNEFYVDDILNRNIENGLTVKVFEVEDYICWGTPNDLKTYEYWENYFYPEI